VIAEVYVDSLNIVSLFIAVVFINRFGNNLIDNKQLLYYLAVFTFVLS